MQETNYKIYMHKNNINNKIYIGVTKINPKTRWSNGNGYKSNKRFYCDIEKYGWDNFQHIILIENLSKEEANKKEIEFIKKYKSNFKKYGYNNSKGGFGKKNKSEKTTVHIRISKSLKEKLEENGKKIGLNLSQFIRYSLTKIIEEDNTKRK